MNEGRLQSIDVGLQKNDGDKIHKTSSMWDTAPSNTNSNSNCTFVDIDISSCLLGDEGLKKVLDAILSVQSFSPPKEDVTECYPLE